MQTLYYTTSSFTRRTGTVVDLQEYRRRLALEQQTAPEEGEEEAAPARPERRRRPQVQGGQGLLLDACASMGILVMTLTVTLRFLCL